MKIKRLLIKTGSPQGLRTSNAVNVRTDRG